EAAAAAPAAPAPAAPPAAKEAGEETAEERLRRRSSPLVRRIAEEHGIDLSQVPGTGEAGRVTKQDILSYIEQREKAPAAPAAAAPAAAPATAPAAPGAPAAPARPAAMGPVAAEDFWKIFYGQVQHP